MEIVHDNDCKAVPFPAVREILDFLPYGHQVRCMIKMLYLTGCREKEMDRMRYNFLAPPFLYWKLGKSQKGWRKKELPLDFIKELEVMRATHRVRQDLIFGISATTCRRYFNRDVRPFLGPAWQQKRVVPRVAELGEEYVLQLKGLRKTYQTLRFAQELAEWGSPDIALEVVSKEMQHSSTHMTFNHYVENFAGLGIKKQRGVVVMPTIEGRQGRIMDYY